MSSETINNIISSVVNSEEMKQLVDSHLQDHMEEIKQEVIFTIRNRVKPISVSVHKMETDDEDDNNEEEDDSEEDEDEEDEDEENDCDCNCKNCQNSLCEECHEAEWEWIWNCCDTVHAMDERCANCSRWYCECDENLYDPIHKKSSFCKKCGTTAPTKSS